MNTPGAKEKTYGTLSQINVTPLVDVVLVLLIIFMVTAPMMSAGVEVDLPTTSNATASDEERLVVSVTRERNLYVGERRVPYQLLSEQVRQQLGSHAPGVALRADRNLDYGYVLLVIDAIRRAGVEDVGLIVDPLELPDSELGSEEGASER